MFKSIFNYNCVGRIFGMQDTLKQWPILKSVAYVRNRCRSKYNECLFLMANHLHVCPGNKYANRYDKIYAGLDTAKTTLNIES